MTRWTLRLLAALTLTTTLAAPATARPGPAHTTTYQRPWLFVGDSLTQGWRADPGAAFPTVFDRATRTVWTINAGRNGSCLIATGCYAWHPWTTEFEHIAYPRRPDRIPGRIIVLLGTNDLCKTDITIDQLQEGYLQLATIAAEHGTPITFLTLLPQAPPQHAYCEDDRTAVNAWLLTDSGLDAVDVSTPLADPDTGYLRPEYDADDGLHITAAAHQVIAATLQAWDAGLEPSVSINQPAAHSAVR